MTNGLKEKGFVHLTNQDEVQLQEILSSLGSVIMTTDVIIKKESKGLVTTALGIDFHTDHHNAKFIAWYCYKQTDLGGDSLLIDAEKIYLNMPIEQQESLKTVELFEHKIFPGDKSSYPFSAAVGLPVRLPLLVFFRRCWSSRAAAVACCYHQQHRPVKSFNQTDLESLYLRYYITVAEF